MKTSDVSMPFGIFCPKCDTAQMLPLSKTRCVRCGLLLVALDPLRVSLIALKEARSMLIDLGRGSSSLYKHIGSLIEQQIADRFAGSDREAPKAKQSETSEAVQSGPALGEVNSVSSIEIDGKRFEAKRESTPVVASAIRTPEEIAAYVDRQNAKLHGNRVGGSQHLETEPDYDPQVAILLGIYHELRRGNEFDQTLLCEEKRS